MTEMRVRKPKYPQPEPEPEKPKERKKSTKSHNKEGITEIATVDEFDKDPMTKVKTRILEINSRWYFDIRIIKTYVDRNTQEEKESRGKGICLSMDFIPEVKGAISKIEKFLDESVE